MQFTHSIVIGDWSEDGHEKSKTFTFRATHERASIISAYQQAVSDLGLALHNESNCVSLLSRYEDNQLTLDIRDRLVHGNVDLSFLKHDQIDDQGAATCDPEDVARLFLEFVRSRLVGFEYEIMAEQTPINGFWQSDFNETLGYGAF